MSAPYLKATYTSAYTLIHDIKQDQTKFTTTFETFAARVAFARINDYFDNIRTFTT